MSAPSDTSGRAPRRIESHVDVTVTATAVELLARASGLSRTCVKQAMTRGAAWLTRGRKTRRIRRATRVLAPGDRLHLYYDERVLSLMAPPPILHADEGAYSVWQKSFGMRSQGSRWSDHLTVTRYAEQHLRPERTAFVVHRLDRAATGLMVIAHEKRAAAALSALFRNREVEKRYRAIVHGRMAMTERPLVIDAPIDGRDARSEVGVLEQDEAAGRSLLEIRIDTGRKHQIRRHLAGIGHPVVGDRLYGEEGPGGGGGPGEDLRLSAVLLAFRCPLTGADRRYALPEESPLPVTADASGP